MDIEELKKDREELEKQRVQLIANLNAVVGAINYIDSKLKEPGSLAPVEDGRKND